MQIDGNFREHLAAIVDGSDDAIITKTLDSIICSWNPASERLFGYQAAEAIGQPISMLLPEDRFREEEDVISRLRKGERVRHFETVRKRKNGSLVPVSLTISPVRDAIGKVVAASKIARDISQQKEAAEQQRTILAEMLHRVRNCFAVAGGLVSVCAREAQTAKELASLLRSRFAALAAVQSLAIRDPEDETSQGTTLWQLLRTIQKPFLGDLLPEFEGADVEVCQTAITPLALAFYELCTNSVKFGAFGSKDGKLSIRAVRQGPRLIIRWREECPPWSARKLEKAGGFGTRLFERSVRLSLNGKFERQITREGLIATFDLELAKVIGRQVKEY